MQFVLSPKTIKDGKAALLIGVFVLSRALSAWALVTMKSARPQGMLDDFSRAAQARLVTASGCIYAALCLLFWLIAGGVFYSIGAVIYGRKKSLLHWKLGFHEIFHIFIMIGTFCHYVTMLCIA